MKKKQNNKKKEKKDKQQNRDQIKPEKKRKERSFPVGLSCDLNTRWTCNLSPYTSSASIGIPLSLDLIISYQIKDFDNLSEIEHVSVVFYFYCDFNFSVLL